MNHPASTTHPRIRVINSHAPLYIIYYVTMYSTEFYNSETALRTSHCRLWHVVLHWMRWILADWLRAAHLRFSRNYSSIQQCPSRCRVGTRNGAHFDLDRMKIAFAIEIDARDNWVRRSHHRWYTIFAVAICAIVCTTFFFGPTEKWELKLAKNAPDENGISVVVVVGLAKNEMSLKWKFHLLMHVQWPFANWIECKAKWGWFFYATYDNIGSSWLMAVWHNNNSPYHFVSAFVAPSNRMDGMDIRDRFKLTGEILLITNLCGTRLLCANWTWCFALIWFNWTLNNNDSWFRCSTLLFYRLGKAFPHFPFRKHVR